uniref:NADH dehydrogenase subunit 2 n=1 Tax=Echinostoma hortense TaxID=48216 RepID=A0A0M4K560_9TREM|nr:NADH dehydrogenase subunit 2 [Echinostoma hortense]
MRGLFLSVFGVFGVVFFSWSLFVANGFITLWLAIELASLAVVPLFFVNYSSSVLTGLFNYFVASSIASSLMLCGLLYNELIFMTIIGFLVKFGLFPLWGWVYKVFLNSNWLVVWSISTFLKFPFFLFPYFLFVSLEKSFVYWLSCLSLVLLSLFFWFYTYSWFHCWCHMMLSSSATLIAMSLSLYLEVFGNILFIYIGWSTAVIVYLYNCGGAPLSGTLRCFWFCFLLLSTPVSFSIFYKLLMIYGVYSCNFVVLSCWVIYSISEQFYLLKYLISYELPKSSFGVLGVV